MPAIALSGRLVKIVQIFIVIFLVYYIVISIGMSINTSSIPSFPPSGITAKWFTNALQPWFFSSLRDSLVIASCATILSALISIPAAMALTRYEFPGKEYLNTLFLSPLIVPGVVAGTAFLFYFNMLGMQNTLLNLIVAHLVIVFPYMIRTVTASLIGIDPHIEEAARTLGASSLTVFTRMTLPLVSSGVTGGAIIAFITSLDNVPVSIFLTSSQVNTIPVVLFYRTYDSFDPTIAAAGIIMMIFTLIMVMIVDKAVGLTRFFELQQG